MDLVAQTEQERRIRKMIEPALGDLGMELVRVRVMGGRRSTLQLMVERAGGAPTDVEDCANASRRVSERLDAADPISGAYTLEVSTPGIDRPLTRPGDFARWEGHLVKIELAMPVDGRRRFQGVILAEENGEATIELEDGETGLTFRIDELTKASLVLTDELIDAAAAGGTLPPQPGEDGVISGFEMDAAEDEDDSENVPDTDGPDGGVKQ